MRRSLARGKQTLVFCKTVRQSKELAKHYSENGVRAEHIGGEMSYGKINTVFSKFVRGEIKVISSCDIISEGFDVPAVECIQMLRSTKSKAMYLQQSGRAMRPALGKTKGIILDHVNNSKMHGLPIDTLYWSLHDGDKPNYKEENVINTGINSTCHQERIQNFSNRLLVKVNPVQALHAARVIAENKRYTRSWAEFISTQIVGEPVSVSHE